MPTSIMLPMRKINWITMVGAMQGSVMLMIWRNLPASSMIAASYSCGSMPVMAAK